MKTFVEYIEEQNLLMESPNYTKSKTKLPVNIYVSPSQASHGPRIKFQNNYNDRVQPNTFLSMSISSQPEVLNPNNMKVEVDKKDISKIKNWVAKYEMPLLYFWNGKIERDELDKLLNIS